MGGDFQRETLTINGVKVVVLTAGEGEPLVFFHGAGTFHGFDFALPWTERFRVIIPYHPGFGESGDDPGISTMHDYVMHYLDVFDALNLSRIRLVGFSLGGCMAATFATEHREMIEKLVLIAPAGLRDDAYPQTDILKLRPDELPPLLVSDMAVLQRHMPAEPDFEYVAQGYREITSVARLWWEHPYERNLGRYLHRIQAPTLLVWGEEDKLIPAAQSENWRRYLSQAEVQRFSGAGHLVLDEKPEAVEAIGRFLS